MNRIMQLEQKRAQATVEYFAILMTIFILTSIVAIACGAGRNLGAFSKIRENIIELTNVASGKLTQDYPAGHDPFGDP